MLSDRFFSATAMAGRLHVNDVGEYVWDPARIQFWNEPDVDAILPRLMVTVKVRTAQELDEQIARSVGRPASISLFVHESLVDTARSWWEKMREDLQNHAPQGPG